MRRASLCLLALALTPTTLPAGAVDYVRDVKPALAGRCYSCHGALRQRGKLRLDAVQLLRKGGRNGPAVTPGKPDESLLVRAVLGKDHPRMPPRGEGEPLKAAELAALKRWIAQGAKAAHEPVPPDPRRHWAYRRPVRPLVPKIAAQGTNPVDAFVAAARVKRGLLANPAADRAALLRRVYLDLIGLPPTRAELHAFRADAAPDAYEKVVEKLLASPQYGQRWGRHWMDVWRYSDPFGYNNEFRYSQRHIWRWRDWIVESLNADKGYDRMLVEMLAGDEVAPADRATLRATGYLARNWYKFNRNAWLQDTVEYTAASFLGVTLRCARCHDHKFDPIAQKDYYRFRAFFEPHDVRLDPIPGQTDVTQDGVARVFDAKPDAPTYLFIRGDDRQPDKSKALAPGVPGVLGGEPEVTKRVFGPREIARALEPAAAEALALARTDVAAAAVPRTGAAAALAEKRLTAARAELTAVEARVAAERVKFASPTDAAQTRQLARAAGKAERQAALARAEATLLEAEQAPPASNKKAAVAAAQRLTALRKARDAARAAAAQETTSYTPLVTISPASSTGRRLALAKWIASKDNPLTARVAVNHIWLRHFGRPLVPTVANFGPAGKPPSHPELLDWLAVEFMESGWSMKHLHRLLVTSQTYRLSSHVAKGDPRLTADPENRTLWRMNPRRMEAEVVRDSLLAVAGRLDPTAGGPPLDEKLGQTSRRRSLYFRFNTEYRMLFLEQFDAPSPNECFERSESVIPQQSLALMNSALALTQARHLAARLSARAAAPAEFVTAAFETVLGRAPTGAERERCERFLRAQAELLRNPGKLTPFPPSADSVPPPSADPARRARENLVQVLFNHNDFVTIR